MKEAKTNRQFKVNEFRKKKQIKGRKWHNNTDRTNERKEE